MRSVPPDSKSLDASWGSEEADLDATQPVDAQELLARAGLLREEQGAAVDTPSFSIPPPPDSEGKITLPPPIPVSDYVAKMMTRRSHSSSEIAAQRRPPEAPPEGYPPAPTRRTIPWEPPPAGGSRYGASPRETARLGLECDEPGVPSRPGERMGLGALLEPELDLGTELDEDLLRGPSQPYPRGFGEIDVFGSAELDAPGASAPASARGRSPGPDAGERLGIDFRLDLGLGHEEPGFPMEEQPITPPPGTLRYGLIVEEDEPAFRGGTGALAGSTSYRVSAGSQGAERAPRPSDSERAPASAARAGGGIHSRATEPQMSIQGPREQMQHRFDLGDFGGALVIAEGLLEENPKDWMARQYADSCVEMLRQMYQARLGDGSRVLRLAVPPDQIRSLSLDHRAGFLLSCIDGSSSIDEILDVSGMQTLEALRILYELVQEGIVCGV
ncbi:uncharacterized protein SOCEGT47_021420 [Sorangium cellulosum]|uniref:No similarity n=1 Tax=Sorangium cellulosum TaxID=56 RepID=A0A4P2PYJ7_SORCE|nr:hypothetical protein [Sorangium cellulosum]AUX21656.1 uncharacterized protein SOCEGT47_021420 [Sorangium cellulosum]